MHACKAPLIISAGARIICRSLSIRPASADSVTFPAASPPLSATEPQRIAWQSFAASFPTGHIATSASGVLPCCIHSTQSVCAMPEKKAPRNSKGWRKHSFDTYNVLPRTLIACAMRSNLGRVCSPRWDVEEKVGEVFNFGRSSSGNRPTWGAAVIIGPLPGLARLSSLKILSIDVATAFGF